jgi:hypothetical protein
MWTKLAIAAALVGILSGSALAGDHDTETELRDSGRYVPQANLPEWNSRGAPPAAYAAARRMPRGPASAFASARPKRPTAAAAPAPAPAFNY